MTVSDLHKSLSERFPKELSCSWDNDGIMVTPGMNTEVRRVLITLDASMNTLEYAASHGFDTVLTHHPMIFRGVKSINDSSSVGQHILFALKNGLSVLSFHTRLDAANGGVNDTLCRAIGYEPTGHFGDEDCLTLCRTADIPPISAIDLAMKVKAKLDCSSVKLTGDPTRIVRTVGFCGGDGKSLVFPALLAGCDAFITGDAGYNITADAAEEGLITIEAGHFHTEYPVCFTLYDILTAEYGLECEVLKDCPYHVV